MRYHRFLIFIVLVLTFTVGCSKEDVNLMESEAPDPAPFVFDRENIVKVTIKRGDGQLAVELTDNKGLDKLKAILDNASPFTEAYPFDSLGVIVIEWKNGTKRELEVTGNGHVFVDKEVRIAYALNKKAFFDFVGGLQ